MVVARTPKLSVFFGFGSLLGALLVAAVLANASSHHVRAMACKPPSHRAMERGIEVTSLPTDDLELPSIDQGSRAAEDDERLAIHLAQEASNATTLDDARYANLKRPYRWGASAKVSEFSGVSMRHRGAWSRVGDREWVWRLRLTTPGATSQQVVFSSLWLPPGAELWAIPDDRDGDDCSGCLALLPEDTNDEAGLALPVVPGSSLVLEVGLTLPADMAQTRPPRLHVAKVIGGFRTLAGFEAKAVRGPQGISQACNNDATCPLLGDEWEDARRSVVQIITSGGSSASSSFSAVCTGTLINSPTGRNFVLTAYHCLEGETVSDWSFVFNYEKECGRVGHQTSAFQDYLSGARLVWADKATDTILLEVHHAIPEDFGAYFAGWDARPLDPLDPFTVSFHHPSGDFKKVSVDTNAKAEGTCPFCGSLERSHIVVTGWDDGTTERGSSGCSLFNSDQRVVGVLSGGSAACPDNTGFDLYGKLQVAMGRGLGEFLAPGGELEMEGRYAADPATSLVFEPRALVVAEDGEAEKIRVRLRDPVEEGAEILVFVSLHADDDKWAKSVFPRELRFGPQDWDEGKTVTVLPRDNPDFHGDVRYFLRFEALHSISGERHSSDYPVVHQDDERLAGDALFDPIKISTLPFSFLGDTSSGYTNTLQSRCELGSLSPDVVFEFSPQRDTVATISLCSLQLFDSALYVIEDGGAEVYCNDDGARAGCGDSAEIDPIIFKGGKTYQVIVDGYNGAGGRFQLDVHEVPLVVDSFDGHRPVDTYTYAGASSGADTYFVPHQTSGSSNKVAEGTAASQSVRPVSHHGEVSLATFFSVLDGIDSSGETETAERAGDITVEAADSSSQSLCSLRNALDLLVLLAAAMLYF